MQNILGDLPFLFIYLDDILIFSTSKEQRDEHLEIVFLRLAENGLAINQEKCAFHNEMVSFLGYQLDKTGYRPEPSNVQQFHSLPCLANNSQLRRTLGMFNFYRQFIPQAAEYTALLFALVKANTRHRDKTLIKWTHELNRAYNKLVGTLARYVELTYPEADATLSLTTDASDIAIGGVLEQQQPDGNTAPLGFYSQKLTMSRRIMQPLIKNSSPLLPGLNTLSSLSKEGT